MTIALFLHVVSDVIWIGGMFLAYVACARRRWKCSSRRSG